MSVRPLHATIDRIPPHNLEAEMAVLGSILVDKKMMEIVDEIVRPGDFYAHVHETIYDALLSLWRESPNAPLDKIVLADELRSRDALERVGGLSYINALMDTVQTAASARYYATIVHEKAVLRSLIHAGTEITQTGYEGEEDVAAALDKSQQLVFSIGQRGVTQFIVVGDMMKTAFDHIDRLFHNRGDRTGLTAGFHDIDAMTTGFQPGNFVIVAARPGMGKTSFALNMAVAAAREEDAPVAFFSLEMSNDELIQRLICSEARISMNDMRRGNIKPHQWEDISRAMGELNDLPIYLDDTGGLTVSDVRSRARRLKSSNGKLAAIFVDYLQLLRPSTTQRNANRNEEISEICRTLKVTAKDIGVPIIALAQLNRGVETRGDKRPMLADLRDCLAGGSLVVNADTGERLPIAQIVENRLRFNVWAMDERLKLVRRPIVDAWQVGTKELFRVTTESGRVLRCTGGHRLLSTSGWKELRELGTGESIAVPRRYENPSWKATEMTPGQATLLGWLLSDGHLGGSAALTVATAAEAEIAVSLAQEEFGLRPNVQPERANTSALRVVMTTGRLCGAGKNPLTTWLRKLGIWKVTGSRKHVPPAMFSQSDEVVAAFLRGLFHADGSLSQFGGSTRVQARLSTISENLARDVRHLLLRFGIDAFVKSDTRNIGGFRTKTTAIWTVSLTDRDTIASFLDRIGFLGEKHDRACAKLVRWKQTDAAHYDRIPLEVNERVRHLRKVQGFSHASLGWRDQGKRMSRATSAMLAERLADPELVVLANADVVWERIVAVEANGVEPVYDLTVGDLHNFCVDDVLTHNSGSLEQEADVVAFLYREGYYNQEAPEQDLTEFIISKHRNGPTGTVKLRFQREYTLFQAYGDESRYPSP
ncbi:MAG: replicative DNA helicase [Candidatus Eremiobacteraeota bacterium]|nr:replicative DNA helicase [Candidatus Eremiobacteraeota bacterium]